MIHLKISILPHPCPRRRPPSPLLMYPFLCFCISEPLLLGRSSPQDYHLLNEDRELWLVYEGLKQANRSPDFARGGAFLFSVCLSLSLSSFFLSPCCVTNELLHGFWRLFLTVAFKRGPPNERVERKGRKGSQKQPHYQQAAGRPVGWAPRAASWLDSPAS